MMANIPEYRRQEIGATIDHRGMIVEVGRRIDHAEQFDDLRHTAKVAQGLVGEPIRTAA